MSKPKGRDEDPGFSRFWIAATLVAAATVLLFRNFIFSDRMLFGNDTLSLGYMARDFFARAVSEEGVFPRWNPVLLGGTPFLESLAGGDTLYPTTLLLFLVEPYRALGWKLVLHVFVAGLFMWGWVRALGRSRVAALVAGLGYAVAPFMVTLVYPGHDGKLYVTALTPLLFWAMESTFTRRGLLPYVGVALVVAVVILSTHFQLAYFLFGAAGAYYLARVVIEARGGATTAAASGATDGAPVSSPRARAALRFGVFLAASVAGAGVAGVQLIPAVGYVTEFSRRTATTTRASPEQNRAYAASWSMHPEEIVGLVVPEFPGNDAGGASWAERSYWGRNATRDNHQYAGLVVLLLAVVGLFGMPRRGIRWFMAGLGATAILYALGSHSPVWRLFYEVVPGVSLFRAPDSVAFLYGFAAVTLAAFGVDRILRFPEGDAGDEAADGSGSAGESGRGRRRRKARRKRKGKGKGRGEGQGMEMVLLGLTGLLTFGLLLAASGALFSFWTGVIYPDLGFKAQILEAQKPFIVRGFFLAAALAGMVFGVVWAARRGVLKSTGIAVALALLVFIDGFRISHSFVQTVDFDTYFAPDAVARQLLQRGEEGPPFRVADMTRGAQETRLGVFGIELATGHHPNDLHRYRELIGMEGSQEPRFIYAPAVWRTLNVEYFVWPGVVEGVEPLATVDGVRGPQALYRSSDVPDLGGGQPLEPLPRARLVGHATVVAEEDAVATLLSPSHDPAVSTLLTEPPPIDLAGGPVTGAVEWVERGINRHVLRVRNDQPALLVVADNWYPEWHATVDGTDAPVLRADHTLRAVALEAGDHEVVFEYEASTLRSSLVVSLVTLLILAGVAGFDLLRARRDDAGR